MREGVIYSLYSKSLSSKMAILIKILGLRKTATKNIISSSENIGTIPVKNTPMPLYWENPVDSNTLYFEVMHSTPWQTGSTGTVKFISTMNR